jgi:hypothetical protein
MISVAKPAISDIPRYRSRPCEQSRKRLLQLPDLRLLKKEVQAS